MTISTCLVKICSHNGEDPAKGDTRGDPVSEVDECGCTLVESNSPDRAGDSFDRLLKEARLGCKDAFGKILSSCERPLCRVARRRIPPSLHSKSEAMDLVQDTFLLAYRYFGRFAGETKKELQRWLHHLLRYNLRSLFRTYRTLQKRQIGREVPIDDVGSRNGGACGLAAHCESPSSEMIRCEESCRLWSCVSRLPVDYQTVLHLRVDEGHTFAEIGEQMIRTEEAARKLWVRALRQLKMVNKSREGV